ncbi:hypothetical protein [Paraurantiacibacter namhicola]|uniref:Uncharacterized protein n=1 Tax=Paraurantiacibacter namhicola TaxID=645517 RepID=A0A1C7D6C2_9SPHN|nr:hypothetical protein [Paraurantiacibacter namhicola]ANU07005.1 hypothetical protein A6F65_00683 [Paraurantiacibacter namhicola]
MGQYEPKDSRNVTFNPNGSEPGGIERTGPREDAARADARQASQDDADAGSEEGHGADAPRQQQAEETHPSRLPEAQQYQLQAKEHAAHGDGQDKGDAPKPSDRGYGAEGEERLEKLDRGHPQPTD